MAAVAVLAGSVMALSGVSGIAQADTGTVSASAERSTKPPNPTCQSDLNGAAQFLHSLGQNPPLTIDGILSYLIPVAISGGSGTIRAEAQYWITRIDAHC
ncbi:MAG TPA: hypothetical protein VF069_00355 [Streptosporangiaceae bacterium]